MTGLKPTYYIEDKTAEKVSLDEHAKWLDAGTLLPPIGQQEVWAAGVTYLKSRDARMED